MTARPSSPTPTSECQKHETPTPAMFAFADLVRLPQQLPEAVHRGRQQRLGVGLHPAVTCRPLGIGRLRLRVRAGRGP